MVNNRSSATNRRQSHRVSNPYESDTRTNTNSLRGLASNFGRGVSDALTGVDYSDNSAENFQSAPDKGGVRIPTFEEFQKQQEAKNNRFFDMKRQEEISAAKKREQEEQRQLDAIYEELEREIKRYAEAQNKLDQNIINLQKLIIEERTNKRKSGAYAFSIAEIGKMILKTALINVSDSNNWMEALMSKRKKRGSLFATRSKKQGTQYSMSQELSLTRSVQ